MTWLVLAFALQLGYTPEATAIMLNVHQRGIGVAGVYTREIAEAKVQEVLNAAEQAEFPLLCSSEPDEDPKETDG